MISFTVITDTPQRLANFLVSRGVIEQRPDGTYVGVRPGMEWVRVPNPIVTDPGSGTPGQPGYVPPTYDTRAVYLVKFAHESENNEVDGPQVDAEGKPISQYEWSKFGKWVMNNTTQQAAPAGWTINGQPVGNARKVNGENVWLIRDNPDRFGVWQ